MPKIVSDLRNFEVSFPAYRSAFFCLEKLLLTLELHEHEQLYILISHYAWKSFLILKIHIFWTRFFIRKTIYHTTCFRECEDSSLPLNLFSCYMFAVVWCEPNIERESSRSGDLLPTTCVCCYKIGNIKNKA